MQKLFNIFLALFAFTTFNREFRVFGFDLRYAAVCIGVALLIAKAYQFHRHKGRNSDYLLTPSFTNKDLALFYLVLFVSNIGWLWNGLPMGDQFMQLVILNVSNAIYVLVFSLCWDLLDVKRAYRYSLISLGMLAISMLWVYGGNALPEFFHDNTIRVDHVGESGNLFGQSVRVAGFAEDANYACVFSAIGFMLAISYYPKGSLKKYLVAAAFAFCFAISFSRTIAVGLIVACLAGIAHMVLRRSWSTISWVMTIGIILFSLYGLSHIDMLKNSISMATRFMLWENAEDVFLQSPLIGGGLSSVRSANVFYGGMWYVQCHSTFWQVLAEHGLIGIIALVIVFARRFSLCKTWAHVFVLAIFAMLCATSEFEYQQFFVYVLALYPLMIAKESKVFESPGRISVPYESARWTTNSLASLRIGLTQ